MADSVLGKRKNPNYRGRYRNETNSEENNNNNNNGNIKMTTTVTRTAKRGRSNYVVGARTSSRTALRTMATGARAGAGDHEYVSSAAAARYAPNVPTAGPITLAGACESVFNKGVELGKGEQGTVYAIDKQYTNRTGANWSVVMKISNFVGATKADRDETRRKWIEEVKISKTLGDMETEGGLRVAPKIISAWICDNKGYIIMERMKSDLRKVATRDGKRVGEKKVSGAEVMNIDHLNRAPITIQDDYLVLLEHMINNGYLHMDNHPGNLGILTYEDGDHGVLFDFGFTVFRPGMTVADKYNALAFSIGQILEHTPTNELPDSHLFAIFASILSGSYTWGTRESHMNEHDIKAFMDTHKLLRVSDSIVPEVPAGVMTDLYVGAHLYAYLLMFPQPKRYTWVDYDKIYTIRQSNDLRAGTNYTVKAKVFRAKTPKPTRRELEAKTIVPVINSNNNAPKTVKKRGEAGAFAEEVPAPNVGIAGRIRAAREARAAEMAADAARGARGKLVKRGGRKTRRTRK